MSKSDKAAENKADKQAKTTKDDSTPDTPSRSDDAEQTHSENTRGAGGEPEFNEAGRAEDSQGKKTPNDMNAAGLADDGMIKTDTVQDNNTGDRPEHAEIVSEADGVRVRKFGRQGRERFIAERMEGPGRFTVVGSTHDNEADCRKAANDADEAADKKAS